MSHKKLNLIQQNNSIKDDNLELNSTKSYSISYLRSKLKTSPYFKYELNKILKFENILYSYMSIYRQLNDIEREKLKNHTKEQLIQAGVYNDPKLLEFLLLIAEKKRIFKDQITNKTDEECCEYYFNQYKSSNEKWSLNDFYFLQERQGIVELEEIAIKLIIDSRASLAQVIKIPQEITELIKKVDVYFQQAFRVYFGIKSSLSLVNVTYITNEVTEHADKIIGKSFINIQNYYGNKDHFVHIIIHEAMHLCFPGFKQSVIEEGLIEYFIEEMFLKSPSSDFTYSPVSQQYQIRKKNIKSIFQVLPSAENHFKNYFLKKDIRSLKEFIKVNLSQEKRDIIIDSYYTSSISCFFNSVDEFISDKKYKV